MVNLELPAVNVLSKVDHYLSPDTAVLTRSVQSADGRWGEKYRMLSNALGRVLDDYSLVKFFPLDITSEENVQDLLTLIDNSIQYGEDLDVKTADYDYPEKDFEGHGDPDKMFEND